MFLRVFLQVILGKRGDGVGPLGLRRLALAGGIVAVVDRACALRARFRASCSDTAGYSPSFRRRCLPWYR